MVAKGSRGSARVVGGIANGVKNAVVLGGQRVVELVG
jgi:hypothetical protein